MPVNTSTRTTRSASEVMWRGRARRGSTSRRGSAYLLVLATAAIASAVALGALATAQSGQRSTVALADSRRASEGALSAIEMFTAGINAQRDWRQMFENAGGRMSIDLGDDIRADLLCVGENGAVTNSSDDWVRVYARARAGSASRTYSVQLDPDAAGGLDLLRCGLHCFGDIELNGDVIGGPISSSSTITNKGTVQGSVECSSLAGMGTISGSTTLNAINKLPPEDGLFARLAAGAPTVTFSGTPAVVERRVWSATQSPGSVSLSGVYQVSVFPGQTVCLKNMRLAATLLVNLPAGSTLEVQAPLLWTTSWPTRPSLIVQAGVGSTIRFVGSTSLLSESTHGTNFNPVLAPYNSLSGDSDTSDVYPSALVGVFQIVGSGASVTVDPHCVFIGTLVSDSPVKVNGPTVFQPDQTLLTNPPGGYESPRLMRPVRGSQRWEPASAVP